MGQVALGFRSLLIRLTVFFVMAALLAWALGGTLLPRAETVDGPGVMFNGQSWFWQLKAGGRVPGAQWTMMKVRAGVEEEATPADPLRWSQIAEMTLAEGDLYYGGLAEATPGGASEPEWRLQRVDASGTIASHAMPDRLALERQLQRIRQGLDLQEADEIMALRPRVLDP